MTNTYIFFEIFGNFRAGDMAHSKNAPMSGLMSIKNTLKLKTSTPWRMWDLEILSCNATIYQWPMAISQPWWMPKPPIWGVGLCAIPIWIQSMCVTITQQATSISDSAHPMALISLCSYQLTRLYVLVFTSFFPDEMHCNSTIVILGPFC